MNDTKQPSQGPESGVTRFSFWGNIVLSGLFTLVSAYFLTRLFQEPRTLVVYLGRSIFLAGIVTSVVSVILTLQQKQLLSTRLMFFATNILGITVIGLFQGRAPTASMAILVISVVIITRLLPSRLRRSYSVMAVAAFMLMWIIEWLHPAWRVSLEAAAIGPVAAVIFAIVLVVMAVRQSWASLSLRWKMGTIVGVLFLGMLGLASTASSGLQSLRYHLTNIYDFMLVPIVSINDADSALASVELKLENLDEVEEAEVAGYIAQIEANNNLASTVIQRYSTEWVTTTSPEFTEALRAAEKLSLQEQELDALEALNVQFASYLAASAQYIQSINTGQPDAALAEQAVKSLETSRVALQELIAVNNEYAAFSNLEAQTAYRNAFISGAATLGIGLALGLLVSYLIVASITTRINELTQFAGAVQEGKLQQRLSVTWNDEIAVLGKAFNEMTANLQESFTTLEQRVADRTRNLELAAEVGRSVSQVRSLDIMLKDACNLILKEFNLYYVQVYLANSSGSTLELEAGTGAVGVQLLGRGHSLPLDSSSINGRAAIEKRSVVIADTAHSPTFRQNPLLPETRAEMAVPLIVADQVVGVLDMQSSEPGVLSEEVLPAFEALAGQLAVAIQNSNLLAETEQARAEVEKQARRLVRTGWNEHLDAIHKPEQIGFIFDHKQVKPLTELIEANPAENGNVISSSISVTGERLGSLVVEMEGGSRADQAVELVNMVSRQVAQQIENLRLLESAERYRHEAERASRLQTIEGWQEYVSSRPAESVRYYYDTNEVHPQSEISLSDGLQIAVPLKAHDEPIGKVAVQGIAASDQESLEIVNAVAERLSTHIENLRLFEETRLGQLELDKRARQLASVAEVSSVSSRELDIQKMLEAVVFLTQRKFGLYHAHVFLYDHQTDVLQIAACGWKEGDEHEGTHGSTAIPLTQEQSLVARAARTRQAVIVNDVHNEPGWLPNPLLPDTASELAVPLYVGDQLLGVLDVQSDRINAFTEEDASIQTTLAAQVATSLQNARSFLQAQKQAEREAMLNTINQKIQSATSVEAVLQIAARELGHALRAPMTIAQLSMKDQSS